MSLIALPTTSSHRKWLPWAVVPVIALLLLAGALTLSGRGPLLSAPVAGAFHRIEVADMEVRITKDGELQAINAIEIQSQVEGQTTIQTLVKEGTSVKKGDVLITLDSATIRQKIEDTFLELQKAEADLTNAREMREIQISTNNATLEGAQVELTLAQLALKEYEEGTYPQQLSTARTDLDMARINLKNTEEKLGQTKNLFTKGFVTATAVKDDELQVRTAQNNVEKAEISLKVLTEYTHEMALAEKRNAVSQAEQKVARVQRENAASLSQKEADVRAKDQALLVLQRRMERFEEQLAACTIKAPADGMVVYATSNDRNAQSSLQEGAQVRERQNLLRLPDTSSMKAVVRIQEAQVARLREGMRATIQLPTQKDTIGATLTKISVLADSSNRWWNPDLKEYPVDLRLDHTPESLKPGMGVIANIFVERLRNVVAVPLTTLYSVGTQTWVFVRQGEGNAKPVEVKVGATNDTHAQILEGVKAGQDVKILQVGEGLTLLERAGIKVTPPAASEPEDGPPEAPVGMMPPNIGGGEGEGAAPQPGVEPQRPRGERGNFPRNNGGAGGEGRRRGPRPDAGGGNSGTNAPSQSPGGTGGGAM